MHQKWEKTKLIGSRIITMEFDDKSVWKFTTGTMRLVPKVRGRGRYNNSIQRDCENNLQSMIYGTFIVNFPSSVFLLPLSIALSLRERNTSAG